jgi:hypothetical protein
MEDEIKRAWIRDFQMSTNQQCTSTQDMRQYIFLLPSGTYGMLRGASSAAYERVIGYRCTARIRSCLCFQFFASWEDRRPSSANYQHEMVVAPKEIYGQAQATSTTTAKRTCIKFCMAQFRQRTRILSQSCILRFGYVIPLGEKKKTIQVPCSKVTGL